MEQKKQGYRKLLCTHGREPQTVAGKNVKTVSWLALRCPPPTVEHVGSTGPWLRLQRPNPGRL